MMTSSAFAATIATIVLASGCTLGNYHSIHRNFDVSRGKSHFVDIKQRSVMVANRLPGEKGGRQRAIVCAEPSPDALSVYSSAIAAAAEHSSGAKGSFNFSSAESGTTFGLRTQSIQLLRDAYYRACEAYMSESIDEETYDGLIRRLNNQAIGYLAIEQITSGAAIEAGAKADAPDLDKPAKEAKAAEEQVAAAEKTKSEKQAALDEAKKATPAPDAAKLKELEAAVTAADTDLTKKKGELAKANEALLVAAKGKAENASQARKNGIVGEKAVEAAEAIALAVVEADYSPQMCYAHLRLSQSDGLTTYCQDVLQAHLDGRNAEVELLQSVKAAVDKQCGTPGAPGCQAALDAAAKLPRSPIGPQSAGPRFQAD